MTTALSHEPTAIFLIGGLGAGKTELALNLAITHVEVCGRDSADLVDLDIVNPFFRVRKVMDEVEKLGVKVVVPTARARQGDLPSLSPTVWGTLENPDRYIVCDIGGGELGLRPLGRFRELVAKRPSRVLFVINPFRPGFRSRREMLENFRHMEELSALKTTHLVANPHLVGETTVELYQQGYDMIEEFAREIDLPVAFGMVATELAGAVRSKVSHDLFEIRRFWRTPWIFGLEKEG